MGDPIGRMQQGERVVLLYAQGSIVMEQGRVVTTDGLSEQPERHTHRVGTASLGSGKKGSERQYKAIPPRLLPGTMSTKVPVSDLEHVSTGSYRINENWIVSVLFLRGRAVVLSYSAFTNGAILRNAQNDEFIALLSKHAQGMRWRRRGPEDAAEYFFGALINPQGTFVRDDGVLAFTHGLQTRIEHPSFREAVTVAERRREQQRIQEIPRH